MLAMASSSLNRTKKKIVNNQYELNKTTSSVIQAAGGLRKVSAAVFINAASEGTGAARKVTPRPEAELKKLVLIVQSALGIPETNSITLVEMPFNDQPALEVAQQLQQQERKDFWLGLAGKTLYPAAAVGILFVFWRLLKRAPGDVIPLGVPVGQLTNGNGAAQRQRPVVTVEVLNQLIRENPNNMTQGHRAGWAAAGSEQLAGRLATPAPTMNAASSHPNPAAGLIRRKARGLLFILGGEGAAQVLRNLSEQEIEAASSEMAN